jgi:hypothetical protein
MGVAVVIVMPRCAFDEVSAYRLIERLARRLHAEIHAVEAALIEAADHRRSRVALSASPITNQRCHTDRGQFAGGAARFSQGMNAVVRRVPCVRPTSRPMTSRPWARDLAGWPELAGAVSAGQKAS